MKWAWLKYKYNAPAGPPVIGGFPSQKCNDMDLFPCHDVIMRLPRISTSTLGFRVLLQGDSPIQVNTLQKGSRRFVRPWSPGTQTPGNNLQFIATHDHPSICMTGTVPQRWRDGKSGTHDQVFWWCILAKLTYHRSVVFPASRARYAAAMWVKTNALMQWRHVENGYDLIKGTR